MLFVVLSKVCIFVLKVNICTFIKFLSYVLHENTEVNTRPQRELAGGQSMEAQ